MLPPSFSPFDELLPITFKQVTLEIEEKAYYKTQNILQYAICFCMKGSDFNPTFRYNMIDLVTDIRQTEGMGNQIV